MIPESSQTSLALKARIEIHEPNARHQVEFLDALIRQSAP